MKNTLRHLGIIVLVAVIGFSFAACIINTSDDNGGGALAVPTGLTVTAISSIEISLSWNAVPGAVGYYVYQSTTSSSSDFRKLEGTTLLPSTRVYNVPPNTTVYYKVSAYNATGESALSSANSATTPSSGGGGGTAPSAPTGVTAAANSLSSIIVSWSSVSTASGYFVYRSLSASGTYSPVDWTTSTSYTNTGLLTNTTYYYKVAAYNNYGTSSQSSYAQATTQGGGGGDQTFTSIEAFQTWLKSQPNNTISNPYNVRLNVNDIMGSPTLKSVLIDNDRKYVNIDFSGSTLTSIPKDAFFSLSGPSTLTGVIIGNNITSIGVDAFNRATNLVSVSIGNRVTSIGSNAFSSCTSLPSITIPASVTSIDGWAFNYCDSLTSVTFQGSAVTFPDYLWVFNGDLEEKYLAAGGGAGTYTRASNGSTWTKQ